VKMAMVRGLLLFVYGAWAVYGVWGCAWLCGWKLEISAQTTDGGCRMATMRGLRPAIFLKTWKSSTEKKKQTNKQTNKLEQKQTKTKPNRGSRLSSEQHPDTLRGARLRSFMQSCAPFSRLIIDVCIHSEQSPAGGLSTTLCCKHQRCGGLPVLDVALLGIEHAVHVNREPDLTQNVQHAAITANNNQ